MAGLCESAEMNRGSLARNFNRYAGEDAMKKIQEQCGATFDDAVCTRQRGHHGKHWDSREGFGFHMWTDAGAKRILEERAAEAKVSK